MSFETGETLIQSKLAEGESLIGCFGARLKSHQFFGDSGRLFSRAAWELNPFVIPLYVIARFLSPQYVVGISDFGIHLARGDVISSHSLKTKDRSSAHAFFPAATVAVLSTRSGMFYLRVKIQFKFGETMDLRTRRRQLFKAIFSAYPYIDRKTWDFLRDKN